MTLIDNLKQMKRKGRYVVSIDYILKQIELEKILGKGVDINEK